MGRETNATSNRTAQEYDLPFENGMWRNGLFMPNAIPHGQPKPRDIEIIRARIRQSRSDGPASAAAGEAEFRRVAYKLAMATNEMMVRQAVEMLLGGGSCSSDPDIHQAANVIMNNYAPLVPLAPRCPQPDFIDGAPPGSVTKAVLEVLSKVIQPSQSQPQSGTAFNLDLEFKGPGGEQAVATRQVLWGCAHGARGIHALATISPPAHAGQSVSGREGAALSAGGHGSTRGPAGQSSDSDGDADTLSAEAYGRTLALGATLHQTGFFVLYTMHIELCAPGRAYADATDATPRPLREYHLVPLDHFNLSHSAEEFWAGVAAFRNMREVARDIRVTTIAAAKERFADVSPLLSIDFTPSQQGNDAPPPARSKKAAASTTGAPAQAATQVVPNAAPASRANAPARRGGRSQASSGKRKRTDVVETPDTDGPELRRSSRLRNK
jgi:hypothetical protein